ncbi:MAG: SDR family oxidoreductase [Acidimicrobiales bacterium]
MKALITGGAGLLGSQLARTTPPGWSSEVAVHTAPGPAGVKAHRIDLAQPLAAFELFERRRPDVVIHTAYSKTDHAATVDSTTEVATACAALDIALIHVSTDALFDGDHAPYAETDEPSPIHPYGRAKALAEVAVRESCPDAVVVRTSLIVATDGSDSTSRWAIESIRAGERVTFFDDEFRMPILVDDLAAQIWEIAALPRAERAGVWHLVGPERLSRVDVGRVLCRWFGLDESLIDVASAATMGEPRPRDVSLSSDRVSSLTCRARPLGSVGAHG